jgi:hypothetical protein
MSFVLAGNVLGKPVRTHSTSTWDFSILGRIAHDQFSSTFVHVMGETFTSVRVGLRPSIDPRKCTTVISEPMNDEQALTSRKGGGITCHRIPSWEVAAAVNATVAKKCGRRFIWAGLGYPHQQAITLARHGTNIITEKRGSKTKSPCGCRFQNRPQNRVPWAANRQALGSSAENQRDAASALQYVRSRRQQIRAFLGVCAAEAGHIL